jgi:hypothetical protein
MAPKKLEPAGAFPLAIQRRAEVEPWMIDDALAGRINVGRSRKGDFTGDVQLTLDGRLVYQLQKFLEEESTRSDSYFRTRWLVLMSEELRLAVRDAVELKRTP